MSKYFNDDGKPLFVWAKGEVTGLPEPKKVVKRGKGGGKGKGNQNNTKKQLLAS